MKNNFHTHTYRCGHANGTEKEMVEAAIKSGLDQLGFSEHVALPHYRFHLFKALFHVRSLRGLLSLIRAFILNGPHMRVPYKQKDVYLKAIEDCQTTYKDIQIYKGFEAEGFTHYFPYYQSLLDQGVVDYLILGHHFHHYAINDNYYGRNNLKKKDIYLYCNEVEKAMESQLFSYLAHPDLFLMGYQKFDIDALAVTRRICEKAKECHIPLEINAGGMRRGLKMINGEELYLYPNAHFWDVVSEVGNDVILGIDAHDPSDFNKAMYQQLEEFAKEHHLHVADHLEFKKGKKKAN